MRIIDILERRFSSILEDEHFELHILDCDGNVLALVDRETLNDLTYFTLKRKAIAVEFRLDHIANPNTEEIISYPILTITLCKEG